MGGSRWVGEEGKVSKNNNNLGRGREKIKFPKKKTISGGQGGKIMGRGREKIKF